MDSHYKEIKFIFELKIFQENRPYSVVCGLVKLTQRRLGALALTCQDYVILNSTHIKLMLQTGFLPLLVNLTQLVKLLFELGARYGRVPRLQGLQQGVVHKDVLLL